MKKNITNDKNMIINYLGNKNLESNTMKNNKIKEIQNISKLKAKSNTNQILSKINTRNTDYLPNKKINDNYVQIKINNIQDPLINNSIEKDFRNRKTIEYKNKGNLNLDSNYKDLLNNNTYTNSIRKDKLNKYG